MSEKHTGRVCTVCPECGKRQWVEVIFSSFQERFKDTTFHCEKCGIELELTDPHQFDEHGNIINWNRDSRFYSFFISFFHSFLCAFWRMIHPALWILFVCPPLMDTQYLTTAPGVSFGRRVDAHLWAQRAEF